jgi:LysM repeat protein
MKTTKREREGADRLDAYVDAPDGGEGVIPEAPVVDTLLRCATGTTPSPEFVERLSARLREEPPLVSQPRGPAVASRWVRQLFAGGRTMRKGMTWAALAAALILALVLPLVFEDGQVPPPLPRLMHASAAAMPRTSTTVLDGLLGGASLSLATELPQAPAEAPVYAVQQNLIATPEEALAWAREFGLSHPRVYRDPRFSEILVVRGDDGRHLIFRQGGPVNEISYGDDRAVVLAEGEPLSFDEATRVAVAFLEEHGLLPAAYRLQEPGHFSHLPERPIRAVEVVPLLDGYPVMGTRAHTQVIVDYSSRVLHATLPTFTFESRHSYPLRSAQEAYAALTGEGEGGIFRLDVEQHTPPAPDVRRYHPEVDHSVGDAVAVTGWAQVLVAEGAVQPLEEGDLFAQIIAHNGARYLLTGPRVTELAEVGPDHLRVSGTLVAQRGTQRWELALREWEVISSGPQTCRVGTLARKEGGAWLLPDEGAAQPESGRYRLPGAPEELESGERIEVCAQQWPVDGGDVEWLNITSPPISEQAPPGSISTSVVVEAQVVKETSAPAPTPTPAAMTTSSPRTHVVQEGETLSAIAGQYEVTVEALLEANDLSPDSGFSSGQHLVIPDPQAVEAPAPSWTYVSAPEGDLRVTPPFEIGQRVEITGVVRATRYVNGDERHVYAQLDVEPDVTLPPYPVTGSQELLEALAQHHPLHVRVWGEVVPSEQVNSPRALPANAGQAIAVEGFEKLWPGEQVQGFLGHVEVATLGDRQVVVFTDHATEQRYVVAQFLVVGDFLTPGRVPLLDFEQIFVAGAVGSGRTYADLPLIRFISGKGGARTEAATSPDQFPLNASPTIVREDEARPDSPQGPFVVDRVELAYYYEPSAPYPTTAPDGTPLTPEPVEQLIQPVWIFHGHNPDGTESFIAYVQAVREEHVAGVPSTNNR